MTPASFTEYERPVLQSVGTGVLAFMLFGASTQGVDYDAFMKLTSQEKRATFATITPTNKALLVRTHAQRWLERHRTELTPDQLAILHESITFVTPQLYSRPAEPAFQKKATELRTKLTCSLGRQRVHEAFTFLETDDHQTWIGIADEWLWWLSECVVK